MEFSSARSRNLHNRSVASHKFLFGASKRRERLSQTDDAVAALVITSFKEFLPFVALVITSIVHLLAWSKIEKISAEV